MIERQRRTKILATLGPATDAPGVLDDLFRAGVNAEAVRFQHENYRNFTAGTFDQTGPSLRIPGGSRLGSSSCCYRNYDLHLDSLRQA